MKIFLFLILVCFFAQASESLNYSGRLVNADGSPVTGPVNLTFDLVFSNAPSTVVCSKSVSGVVLQNGVFHRKLDFTNGECGGSSLLSVIEATPVGEAVAIRVTDSTNSRNYAAQPLNALPYSLMAQMAKTLVRMSATTGQVLTWNGTQWAPAAAGGGGTGSVTNIVTGTGLTGGPITSSGTISIASGGVTTTQIADGTITNSDISSSAAIARAKIATGTNSHVVVNDGSGALSSVAQLPLSQGGTGASTAAGARVNLGLGNAAEATLGMAVGNAMRPNDVAVCPLGHYLKMNVGPTYFWTCETIYTNDSSKLPVDGSVAMSGNLQLASHKITGVGTPTDATDAATKGYVDTAVGGGVLSTPLTGYALGTNAALVATDTVLQSFGKLQAQIAAAGTGSGDFKADGSVAMTGTLKASAGTEAAPGLSFDGDADTGVFRPAANTLSVSTNGTEKLRLTSAGNLGVGTNAPTTKLHVAGSLLLGNGGETCAAGNFAGALRYNAGAVEFCNGTLWQAVSTGAGATPGDNSVTSDKIADGTITNSDLSAVASIDTTKLGTGTVTNTELDYLNGATSNLQTQINSKEAAIAAGTTAQYLRGDKTWQTLNTAGVPESGNLYFLDSRVRATLMSGYAMGSALPIAATDTLVEAIAKLEGSLAAVQSNGQWSEASGNVYRSSGNVGVGTSSPSTKLHVAGSILLGNGGETCAAGNFAGAIRYQSGAVQFCDGASWKSMSTSGGAVDPSDLSAPVPVTKGGTGLTSFTPNRLYVANATGTGLVEMVCTPLSYLAFDVSGNPVCSSIALAASGTGGLVSATAQTMSGLKTFENGIRIGSNNTACNASSEGAIRYNSSNKKMEFCNGTSWSNISSGTVAGLTIGSPSQAIVSTGSVSYTITYGAGTDSVNLTTGMIELSGSDTSGCAVGLSGSGLSRTVTVSGCTGTGTVAISIAAGSAMSTTNDPAAAAGPSNTFLVDNTGPSAPTSVSLGTVPSNLTSTPTITFSGAVDVGGSSVASHQVRIVKTSDSSQILNWTTHTSGTAVSSLSLSVNTQYSVFVRALDALGNVGASTAASNWTSMNDPCIGTPAPGTVCASGAVILGSIGTNKFMTTPGGCGEIPAGQIMGGTGPTAFPSVHFTPSCSGLDDLTKTWNDGTANWYDIPTLSNLTTIIGVGWGESNIDFNDGKTNTDNIVANPTASQNGGFHAAARYCDGLSLNGYTDWYLPNRRELNLFFENKASIPGLRTDTSWYWSSTEYNNFYAWVQRFSDGYQSSYAKNYAYYVRCVRRY